MAKEQFPRSALYKVLGPGLTSCHGGSGKWMIGKRRSVTGKLVPCENGIHVCRDTDIVKWLHTSLWWVRVSKERVEENDKVVVRWAVLEKKTPLNDKLMRLFAADCAERALIHNSNKRLVDTIHVVRRYAFGIATQEDLSAARSAARSAANAEKEWQTARLFDYLNKRVDLKALRASVS